MVKEVVQDGLVRAGRHPAHPIDVTDSSEPPFRKGDVITVKRILEADFPIQRELHILAEDPYRYTYARLAPPDPYYTEWQVELEDHRVFCTSGFRLATRSEIETRIAQLQEKRTALNGRIDKLIHIVTRTEIP